MMAQESLEPTIAEMRAGVIDDIVAKHIPHDAYPEAWDIAGLKAEVAAKLNLDVPVEAWAKEEGIADEEMAERLHKAADDAYDRARRAQFARGDALCREAGDPADARSSLARSSRHARPFAAGDRLARHGAARSAERIQVRGVRSVPAVDRAMARGRDRADDAHRGALPGARARAAADAVPASRPAYGPERGAFRRHFRADRRRRVFRRRGQPGRRARVRRRRRARSRTTPKTWGKIGRNEACPCGSGKKYKHCHGMLA